MPEPMLKPTRRRWFAISLRGMMLLILIVGGLMGWKARQVSLQRRAVAGVKKLNGEVIYDWQYLGSAIATKAGATPPGPLWLRNFLGDDYFQTVVHATLPATFPSFAMGNGPDAMEKWAEDRKAYIHKVVKPVQDDQLACLDGFDRLESLNLFESFPLGPEGLNRLGKLRTLKQLRLRSHFPGGGLDRIAALTNLEVLSFPIDEDQASDLLFLAKLPRLRWLSVGGMRLSDEQLAVIGRVHGLKSLDVFGLELTDAGLTSLKDLKSLEFLSIMLGRNLKAQGLGCLEGMTELNMLHLPGMPMDGAALDRIRKLPKLTDLLISKGRLDDVTLDAFKAARPGVTVRLIP